MAVLVLFRVLFGLTVAVVFTITVSTSDATVVVVIFWITEMVLHLLV